jgi:hypothetical protein
VFDGTVATASRSCTPLHLFTRLPERPAIPDKFTENRESSDQDLLDRHLVANHPLGNQRRRHLAENVVPVAASPEGTQQIGDRQKDSDATWTVSILRPCDRGQRRNPNVDRSPHSLRPTLDGCDGLQTQNRQPTRFTVIPERVSEKSGAERPL